MKRLSVLFSILVLCFSAVCLLSCVSTREEEGVPFVINEICSGNGGHYTVDGSSPDYIELHNNTGRAISLDGYFLSDDEDRPDKFPLAGYSIPAKGYLVLAADKKELPFKLSSSGEELFLSDAEGNMVQYVELPQIEKDTTFSLQPDGTWHVSDPSPMARNLEGVPYVKVVYVSAPRFSHEAGFYDEPFDLELQGYRTYSIYYTTDGTVPDENSTLYTCPIHIEDATSQPNKLSKRTDITIDGATPPATKVKKATIISAVSIDEEGNRSNVVTNAFFVGFQNYPDYQDISILSIVTDPSDLFDEDDGIYVVGKMYRDWLDSDDYSSDLRAYDRPRNYAQHGKEWEIPASIQWFNEDEELCLTQKVGLRIHGNQTRENAQKAFNLYARNEYGAGTFQYPLIDGIKNMTKVVVRGQAGRDSITHGLLRETGLPVSECTPCLVFINGEFWGFYELREKQEEDYLSNIFGTDKDDLMIYKNYRLIEGEDEDGKTNRSVFDNLVSQIIKNNPSTTEGYAYACDLIDMDNYITYMAGITYINSEDIYWNKTLWRTMSVGAGQYEDGRWRWIFQDLDWACRRTDGVDEAIEQLQNDDLFMSLWHNPEFRKQFLTRIMDYANIELTPEYVKEVISPILSYYNQYYAINEERWKGVLQGGSNSGTKLINSFLSFFRERREDVIERLSDILEVTDSCSTISVLQIPQQLKMTVNGHVAHLYGSSWSGVYFSGCEVTFEVNEIPGYRFCGWYDDDTLLTDDLRVTVSTDEDHNLIPAYEAIPVVASMDRINYARSNYKGGYELYTLNIRANCTIVPDAGLSSSVNFTSIVLSSDGDWKKGTGFTIKFSTANLSSCGMILRLTVPEGCPENWKLFIISGNGKKVELSCYSEPTEEGLSLSFELPDYCLGLPEVELHMESAVNCSGGTVRITGISLFGYGS